MQHHPIPGHGMVEFFPSEAIDTLHLLFNIQVLPTLVSQQLGLVVFTCLGLTSSCSVASTAAHGRGRQPDVMHVAHLDLYWLLA